MADSISVGCFHANGSKHTNAPRLHTANGWLIGFKILADGWWLMAGGSVGPREADGSQESQRPSSHAQNEGAELCCPQCCLPTLHPRALVSCLQSHWLSSSHTSRSVTSLRPSLSSESVSSAVRWCEPAVLPSVLPSANSATPGVQCGSLIPVTGFARDATAGRRDCQAEAAD